MTKENPGRIPHPMAVDLRWKRESLGLTQRALAARMGRRQGEISAWETGRYMPDLVSIDVWADALGCELVITEKQPDVEEDDGTERSAGGSAPIPE